MSLDQSHEHVDPHAGPAGRGDSSAKVPPVPPVPAVHSTMPLGDHLEELRGRVIRGLLGVLAAAVVTFYFGLKIIAWLAQPLMQAQAHFGFAPQTIQTDPTAGFMSVYLPVCLIAAAIVASPWILWQAWQFIVTGLYEYERRAVHILAPFSTVMTALGVLFTYYILLPVSLTFFLNFATHYPEIKLTDPNPITSLILNPYTHGQGPGLPDDFAYDTQPLRLPVLQQPPETLEEGMLWVDAGQGLPKIVVDGEVRTLSQRSSRLLNPLPQMGQYVRFAAFMMLGIVLAFQLPVVMLVMGWTQLLDPRAIAKTRKYAFFACVVAGAMLTPADVFSMICLAMPLYALFEFGLLLMRMTYRTPEDASHPTDGL